MKSLLPILRNCMFFLFFVFIISDATAQDNKGNPLPHFLFPGFTKGVTRMKDGKTMTSLLNYNMVEQIMVTEMDGVYRSATKMNEIDTIYLENKKFVPVDRVFYEVLVKGPVSFFLQNRSNFTPRGADVGYGSKSQSVGHTSFTRYELTSVVYQYQEVVNIDLPPNVDVTPASVFWVRKNDTYEKFSSEKQFLKIFPEQSHKLKEYIKKEKLNLKNRDDVVKLGLYCNLIMK